MKMKARTINKKYLNVYKVISLNYPEENRIIYVTTAPENVNIHLIRVTAKIMDYHNNLNDIVYNETIYRIVGRDFKPYEEGCDDVETYLKPMLDRVSKIDKKALYDIDNKTSDLAFLEYGCRLCGLTVKED